MLKNNWILIGKAEYCCFELEFLDCARFVYCVLKVNIIIGDKNGY